MIKHARMPENEEINDIKSEEKRHHEIVKTPIQQFYTGQTIFITGATGFLGKVLIGILLKNCPDIARIYILVRQKVGKSPNERVREFLQDPAFDQFKPKYMEDKIIGIPGDCICDGLGLNAHDRELLKNKVSIILHLAASVRFDEKLKEAAAIHILSTSYIMDLCREMPNLKVFLHVSTAYSNCFSPIVEERFYNYKMKYYELINLINNRSDKEIDELTPKIIETWPNTYTFTKALTEDLIRSESRNLPIGIFRPAVVTASLSDPEPGWIDNHNAATAFVSGILRGTMRTMQMGENVRTNFVPVDLTSNAIIAAAWNVAQQHSSNVENIPIYNFATVKDTPCTYGFFMKNLQKYSVIYPSKSTMWYPMIKITENEFLYDTYAYLLQSIPSYLVDSTSYISGQKPRLVRINEKLIKVSKLLSYFCINEWDFKDENTRYLWKQLDSRDQELFPFTMDHCNWSEYFENYVKGARKYLYKDNMNTLESNRQRIQRYYWMHQGLKYTVVLLPSGILFKLLSKL